MAVLLLKRLQSPEWPAQQITFVPPSSIPP
jgi:hypothetical protein